MRVSTLAPFVALLACTLAHSLRAELVIETEEEPALPRIDPSAKLPAGAIARLQPPTGAPRSVAISPDGKRVAVAGAGKTVQIFDAVTFKQIGELAGHEGTVHDVAFSPDNRYLASAGEDHLARLWDLKTFKSIRSFEGHGEMVKGLCFSPDGAWLATAGGDQLVKVWDVETGQVRYSMSGHEANVDRITWSRDGRTLLSEAADSTARLWDGSLGQEISVLTERDGEVASVAISPDGRLGISTRGDLTWHVFEIAGGRDLVVLRGQAGNGSCAAFSPDGRSVYTGAVDGSVRQWDLSSGLMLRRFLASGPRVVSLAVSPDGTRMVTASMDCNVLVWDLTLPPANPAAVAEQPQAPLEQYLAKSWDLLESSDYDARTMALWRFLNAGEAGAKALADHLPMARGLDSKEVQRLIAKLDDASYGVREATMQDLRDLGADALPYLRDALDHASPEVQMRAYDLLHATSAYCGVRNILAVEALGWMKSPLAKEHLAKLAKGSRDQAITQQAQAVLSRK